VLSSCGCSPSFTRVGRPELQCNHKCDTWSRVIVIQIVVIPQLNAGNIPLIVVDGLLVGLASI